MTISSLQHYYPMVYHVVKNYPRAWKKDLVADGMLALQRAVHTYNPEHKTKFSTYAFICIRREVARTAKTMYQQSLFNDEDMEEYAYYWEDPSETFDVENALFRMKHSLDDMLSVEEKDILAMRYGLYGNAPQSIREIAETCSTSTSSMAHKIKTIRLKLQLALWSHGPI